MVPSGHQRRMSKKVIKNYFVPEPSPYVSIGDSLTTYAIYMSNSRDVAV